MSRLLASLLAFLRLPVGEADNPPPGDTLNDPGGGESVDPADPADDLDTGALEDDQPVTTPAKSRREMDLEAEVEALRSRQQQPAPTPQPTHRDPDYEREEAQLAEARKTATPEQMSWMEWQVDTNRRIRANDRNAQAALMRSTDMADRASFDALAMSKPKLHKMYAARVEEALAGLQKNGQFVSRTIILRTLIGDDMLNDKLKSKKREPAAAAPATTVDRGRSPVTRSDVSGRKGPLTEREKRRQRLDGQII